MGVALGASQIRSVAQLVGRAVPGLDPSAITITDHLGNLLTRQISSPDNEAEQANDQLATKERVENMLTKKAQELLDKAVGIGKSITRVNVELDFSHIEKRNERFSKEGKVVKSEVISTESSSSPSSKSKEAAGVVANIPVSSPGKGTLEQELSKSKKEDVRTEYAIPSGVERIVQKGARINSVSISVAVAKQQEPRSQDELKKNRATS